MSHDMGTDEQLYAAMRRAVEAEPAMGSAPRDDLVRGRRLLRRRRVGGAVTVTALVPAVALLGSGLAPGGSGSTGSAGFADDGSEGATTEDTCARVDEWSGSSGGGAASPRDGGQEGRLGVAQGSGGAAQQPGGIDPQGAMELQPDGAVSSCDEPSTYSVDTEAIDRIQEALLDGLGPERDHVDSLMSSIGTSGVAGTVVSGTDPPTEPADAPTAAGVSGRWTEGTGLGAVTVSVSDGDDLSGPGGEPVCADPSLGAGPELTCEQQTLNDGTTVLVGRGEQDGAQRITVRYQRPDGQVVSATADQASEDWWADGSGTGPLEQPPLTVEQLAEIVRDPLMHL